MVEEEYELFPNQLLSDLKYDVEALKKKLTQPDAKAEELLLEIESLKDTIQELTTVFQKALEQTKGEDPTNLLQGINEKLNSLASQNEIIARGMVAISDKVDDFINRQMPRTPAPAGAAPPLRASGQHTIGLPSLPGGRVAPPLQMEARPISGAEDLPPPPPSPGGKKRVGFFK